MTRQHTATHPARRLPTVRSAAATGIALCLLTLTACAGPGFVDAGESTDRNSTTGSAASSGGGTSGDRRGSDDRPESDEAAFFDEVRSLPAVEDVELLPDDGGGAGADPAVASRPSTPAPRHTVVLAEDADAADLRTTERELQRLYNDFRYPDGVPLVRLTSGLFSADVPEFDRAGDEAKPHSQGLNLADLPNLHALPAVETGRITSSLVVLTLSDGTDLRAWVAEATGSDGSSTVQASLPTPGQVRSDSLLSFEFTLGADTAAEAARTLFDTADAVGASLVRGRISDDTSSPSGEFHVPIGEDLPALYDQLVAAYGTDQVGGFSATTNDDLTVHFSAGGFAFADLFEARDQLDAAGADVRSCRMDEKSVKVLVEDAGELRAVVRPLTAADWPLDSDATLTVQHADTPSSALSFDAQNWNGHADLVASLWEAGFTAVDNVGQSQTADVALTIRDTTGPTFRHADGRDALVDALRSGGWTGTATITLASVSPSGTLTFDSTADGKATSTGGPSQRRTTNDLDDWAQEFLEAWDASAG